MALGPLLSEDLILPDPQEREQSPLDSSRILLGLMRLSRQAESDPSNPGRGDSLDGVIAKSVLRRLLSALHFRDVASVRHSRRVAVLALAVAQYLGWEGRQLTLLEVAALLHDIGKIGVPDNILFKPGRLSPDEADLMALHRNIGVDVLQACRVDPEVLQIVAQSFRQYGNTDEYRRKDLHIHQGARILAVADAYDSLRTEQVYRPGKDHEGALAILHESAGAQFDGNVVQAFARWIETEGMPFANGDTDSAPARRPPGPADTEETLEASSLSHIFSYLYVLESLYDGFYLLDSDLQFVVWNQGAEDLFNCTAQEMLGRVWTSGLVGYSHPEGQEDDSSSWPLKRAIATGKAATATIQLPRTGRNNRELELQSVPLLDRHGQLRGVAEIFRDLSRGSRRPQHYRELRLAAIRDPLTSVANRGELETQLTDMLSDYAQREDPEPFSVIFMDIDYFKEINDHCGHAVGDAVLIGVARLLQNETYSGELIGRYGGEEFVILCPGTELNQALRRAERLRMSIRHGSLLDSDELEVTASFGVTEVEPGDSLESILHRADKALYRAKETGRDQTHCLTRSERRSTQAGPSGTRNSGEEFLYTGTFAACIAADMVVYKLGGFINDFGATLQEVTPNRALIRMGTRRWLPWGGGRDDQQPVEVEVEFNNTAAPPPPRLRKPASRQVPISVRIRPMGWTRDANRFQRRAERILQNLRAYFFAD